MPLKYNNVIRIKNAYLNFYCSRAKFLIYHGIGSVDYWKIWFSVIFHSSIERLIWKHWYELKIDFIYVYDNTCTSHWQYMFEAVIIISWAASIVFTFAKIFFCNATVNYIRVKRRHMSIESSNVTSTIVLIPHKIKMSRIRSKEVTINV